MSDVRLAATTPEFAESRLLIDEIAAWDAAQTSALGFDGDELLRVCYSSSSEILRQKYTQNGARMFLARQSGVIAGCAAYTTEDARTVELQKVYVRPKFRGHGFGRVLMENALRAMESTGRTRTQLETVFFMRDAIALYRRFGFVH